VTAIRLVRGTRVHGAMLHRPRPYVSYPLEFMGVSAGFRDVPVDRNSLLDSNSLRRHSATAPGL